MSLRTAQIVTKNQTLRRKLEFELSELFVCIASDAPTDGADVYLIDRDTSDASRPGAIYLGREGADITTPFRIGEVRERLEREKGGKEIIFEDGCTVVLRGKRIRLTEVEYSLFSAICERGGEPASREELIERVWGKGADEGVLNVYVHYLRQKLESDGEKIILSKRGLGYSLNVKILGGEKCLT